MVGLLRFARNDGAKGKKGYGAGHKERDQVVKGVVACRGRKIA